MTMAERDMRWSEWIRRNQEGFRNEKGVVADIPPATTIITQATTIRNAH
jgi:hypothetical protein